MFVCVCFRKCAQTVSGYISQMSRTGEKPKGTHLEINKGQSVKAEYDELHLKSRIDHTFAQLVDRFLKCIALRSNKGLRTRLESKRQKPAVFIQYLRATTKD